jgi:hypothetical protein
MVTTGTANQEKIESEVPPIPPTPRIPPTPHIQHVQHIQHSLIYSTKQQHQTCEDVWKSFIAPHVKFVQRTDVVSVEEDEVMLGCKFFLLLPKKSLI